jgi:hypothetical protein
LFDAKSVVSEPGALVAMLSQENFDTLGALALSAAIRAGTIKAQIRRRKKPRLMTKPPKQKENWSNTKKLDLG